MKVLLIEDDMGVAEMLQAIVAGIGTVKWSKTWNEGVAEFSSCTYDAILLDLGLPDSGTQTTLSSIKSIKMNCPNTAVIVITGQPMITEEQALKAGADAFISKNNVMRPTRVIQLISSLVAQICGTSSETVRHQLVLHEKAATEVSEQFKKDE